jgi:hypothetical protein
MNGQLSRAERGAVDPIPAGAAADGDDPIARLDPLRRFVSRQDADGPAEDQGIGQVAGIHRQGAVNRRDPHAVPVVAYARDDPLEHPLGVQDSR